MTDRLLVVGGGIAGAALAIPLAEAGWRVTLVEREAGPHDKVCGEFLSREARLYLRALGIDPATLGAVPIQRVRVAGRRGDAAVDLTGVDLNPWSAAASTAATAPGRPIRWVTENLFDYKPAGGIDLIVSSQFTHHLDDDGLVRFLAFMEETAKLGWFVNDLHRHKLPYHFFKIWSRLAGWHRFVQHDGPISISRAFVAADWRTLIARAGIAPDAAKVEWWVPFRLCVSRAR